MMNFTGFLCEYNPFHAGHLRHLRFAQQAGAPTVCILSGPFVQRGEPALVDPWIRAKAARDMGCDAVLLYPAFYCLQPAQYFAGAAMALLTRLGANTVVFGSPVEDEKELLSVQALLDDPDTGKALRKALSQGLSYPRALQQSVAACHPEKAQIAAAVLSSANATLGLEYLKALRQEGYAGQLRILKREADSVSATAIRSHLREVSRASWLASDEAKESLPEPMRELLLHHDIVDPEPLGMLFSYLCRRQEEILLPDDGEGMAARLRKAAAQASGRDAILQAAKTKRYTYSRLARGMLHALLDITPEKQTLLRRELPLYAYPLALTAKGGELLSHWKKQGHVPIIDRPAAYRPQTQAERTLWQIEENAMELYRLLCPTLPAGSLYTHQVVR